MKSEIIDSAKYHWHNKDFKKLFNTFKWLNDNNLLTPNGINKLGLKHSKPILILEKSDLTYIGYMFIKQYYFQISNNDWKDINNILDKYYKEFKHK